MRYISQGFYIEELNFHIIFYNQTIWQVRTFLAGDED